MNLCLLIFIILVSLLFFKYENFANGIANANANENGNANEIAIANANEISDKIENKFKIVKNNFRFKYSQITNHLINTGDVLRINATRLYFNRLYDKKQVYFVKNIEWSLPVFTSNDLEFSILNVSSNGRTAIKFIIPLKFSNNVNFTHSKGMNNIIHSTDHIPEHKFGIWNKGNIIVVNLNNLCFMFNETQFMFYKMNGINYYITQPQEINKSIGLNILNKLLK
jgi:hypothetical protein